MDQSPAGHENAPALHMRYLFTCTLIGLTIVLAAFAGAASACPALSGL